MENVLRMAPDNVRYFLLLFLFIPELISFEEQKRTEFNRKDNIRIYVWAKDIIPTCDWFGPYLHCTKRWDHPEAKDDAAEFVWRPKSLGPSKDCATNITWPLKRFCHQNHLAPQKILPPKSIPKLWRNWRPHKLHETMQNKQAWYFVGQNY